MSVRHAKELLWVRETFSGTFGASELTSAGGQLGAKGWGGSGTHFDRHAHENAEVALLGGSCSRGARSLGARESGVEDWGEGGDAASRHGRKRASRESDRVGELAGEHR